MFQKATVPMLLFWICIVSSLLCIKGFGSPTIGAVHYFSIFSALFAVVVMGGALFNKTQPVIKNPLPIFIFILLAGYVVFQNGFASNDFNLIRMLYVAYGLTLVSLSLLLAQYPHRVRVMMIGIVVISMLESAICILQAVLILPSENTFFPVTGTWVNPNVTALFLMMSLPISLSLYFESQAKQKVLFLISSILILVSIILLKSRTAWIGSIVGILMMSSWKYQVLGRLKRLSIIAKTLIILSLSVCSVIAGIALFTFKHSSSVSRLQTWSISIEMISHKPLLGYGYGHFEREFNLFKASQSHPVIGSNDTVQELGFVYMAYNEPLQSFVEGGLIGFLLFVGFLSSVLFPVLVSHKDEVPQNQSLLHIAMTGVFMFIISSLVNFTIEAVPAMVLFVFFVSLLSGMPIKNLVTGKRLHKAVYFLMFCFGIGALGREIAVGQSLKQVYNIANKRDNHSPTTQLNILSSLENTLPWSENFWNTYGTLLYKAHYYRVSLDKYKKASLVSAKPEIFLSMGYCYEQLGQLDSAAESYQIASKVDSKRCRPVFALMQTLMKQSKEQEAKQMAIDLLQKSSSLAQTPEVYFYQREAKKILYTSTK